VPETDPCRLEYEMVQRAQRRLSRERPASGRRRYRIHKLFAEGRGLFAFRDLKEAAAAVAEIDSDYTRHSRAARKIAEAHFNSRACLEA
jgi:hypothetical protein